jgi:hypothetical protein
MMSAHSGRQRQSADRPDGVRDSGERVRTFREHANAGANGLRQIKLRMSRSDMRKVRDGIAGGAEQMIEG